MPAQLAAALFAAAWTRYEAWAVIGAAMVGGGLRHVAAGRPAIDTLVRRGVATGDLADRLAVVIFLVNSRITVGAWFVSDGFYVPDPTYAGQALRTLIGIWWGTHQLSGYVDRNDCADGGGGHRVAGRQRAANDRRLSITAGAVRGGCGARSSRSIEGHPYRIRYMIPVVGGVCAFCGLAVGLVPGRHGPCLPAMDSERRGLGSGSSRRLAGDPDRISVRRIAAMGQRGADAARSAMGSRRQHRQARRHGVPRRASTSGEKMLASMGSLAHYMQELSNNGFGIADFINEGNGVIWNLALQTGPAPHAGWMLVEEVAEGGDVLAEHVRQRPGVHPRHDAHLRRRRRRSLQARCLPTETHHLTSEPMIGPAAQIDASSPQTAAASPLQPPDSESRSLR